MSFIVYDLIFLCIFVLALVIFLYKNKHNVKRQGLLYLYPTKVGIKFIDTFTKRFRRILEPLQYVVIASGYFLMILVIWMFGKLCYTYIASPTLAQDIKVPVLTPLVPYIDQLFQSNYFPPFYFTSWIIVIAIIAVSHEFAHGIFARLNKIRVHSTGFGFLGPFLAAFVEPDEKQMEKAKKFPQLAILAAGTFANVLMTILFAIVLWVFFALAFSQSGVYFNTYSTSAVNLSEISIIAGIPISANLSYQEFQVILEKSNESILEIVSENRKFFSPEEAISFSVRNNLPYLIAYDDSPAYKAKLSGAILEIDGEKVSGYDSLRKIISQHKPGDNVTIKTIDENKIQTYDIKFADREGNAFLGIGRIPLEDNRKGFFSTSLFFLYKVIDPIKYYSTVKGENYSSKIGDLGKFIYNLLWWIVVINLSVALFNMLPAGIFDGGRFFFLTIWGITGNKKIGEQAFKLATWIILLAFLALMVKWVVAVF